MTDPNANPLTKIFGMISGALAPGLQASASDAADQLNLAFQVLIAEGAVVIVLLGVLILKSGRK